MSFGLKQVTLEHIQSVFAKHLEIDHVVIYGSRAKGNFRNGSNIDLTLIGKGITEKLLLLIKLELNELNTPYLSDISIFDHLNSPDLKIHIARAGQVFYKNARSLSTLTNTEN